MKIRLLALILASASLTACATRPQSTPPNADQFLQPTLIEGQYRSFDALLADPLTTTRNVFDFARAADDANLRCNDDKSSARTVLHGDHR